MTFARQPPLMPFSSPLSLSLAEASHRLPTHIQTVRPLPSEYRVDFKVTPRTYFIRTNARNGWRQIRRNTMSPSMPSNSYTVEFNETCHFHLNFNAHIFLTDGRMSKSAGQGEGASPFFPFRLRCITFHFFVWPHKVKTEESVGSLGGTDSSPPPSMNFIFP